MEQIPIIFAAAFQLVPLLESNPTGGLFFIAILALALKRRKP